MMPEKVLIIHPYGIGDALFVTPLIRLLKENGVKQIDLLLGSRTRILFEHHPFVREIYEWGKTKPSNFRAWLRYWIFVLRLLLNMRRQRYDCVIDLSLAREYAFWCQLFLWIPKRIGFNFKNRGIFLTQKVELPEAFSGKPVAEYYLDLLRFLDIKPERKSLEFFMTEATVDQISGELRRAGVKDDDKFIVVAPGGGESWGKDARLKRWPVFYFALLVRRICGEYAELADQIIIVGTEAEALLGAELERSLDGLRVRNLCGKTALPVTAALVRKACFLIGNDSGLIHLARALQTPLIAFYGPADPNVYGPYPADPLALAITNTGPICRPCYRRMRYQADCAGNECLTTLTPNYVFDQVRASGFFERLPTTRVFRK